MTGGKGVYLTLAAVAASGVVVEAKAEAGAQALANLRVDLGENALLREEYAADPAKVLRRYGLAPEVQIEALAETHGLMVAGDSCICTGCCVTNVNT